MDPTSTVSVVVPFHSNESWLRASIASVLAQRLPVLEVLIICDGCGCDLSHYVAQDNRIRVISTPNRGPGPARNLGIELARGTYVAFLDSDDLWAPEKTERQVREMCETGASWSHTSYSTFQDGTMPTNSSSIVHSGLQHSGRIYPDLLSSCSIATPTVMIRRSILRDNPTLRFSSSMRHGQDMYLWARLSVWYSVLGIDEVLTSVRMRGRNASLQPEIQLRVRAAMWQALQLEPESLPQEEMSHLARIAFRLSVLGHAICNACAPAIRSHSMRQGIAGGLYVLPWLLFKADAWSRRRRELPS